MESPRLHRLVLLGGAQPNPQSESERLCRLSERARQCRVYSHAVRVLRQLGVILLMLISSAAPVMACMTVDAQMSPSERACCRMMKNRCGDMQMPASHGCCHKTLQSVDQNALNAKAVALPPIATIVVALAAYDLLVPNSVSPEWVVSPQYSPPKSPPSAVSVLRL